MKYLVCFDTKANYFFATLKESYKNYLIVNNSVDNLSRKVQHHNILLESETPLLLENFKQQINAIDVELLAQEVKNNETTIEQLCQIYFTEVDNPTNKIVMALAIAQNQVLFKIKTAHSLIKCNPVEINSRLEIIHYQQRELELYNSYYQNFQQNINPLTSDFNLYKFIAHPDKNSIIYRAYQKVCSEQGISTIELAIKLGLIKDINQFYLQLFIFDQKISNLIPMDFNHLIAAKLNIKLNSLPHCTKKIFSIDDLKTDEIDDAFSVSVDDRGLATVGVHIAAPSLSVEYLTMIATRISTIYHPSAKITMLPQELIKFYSLDSNSTKAVVSIYFELDQELNINSYHLALELATISDNLRIENLETQYLNNDNFTEFKDHDYQNELNLLWNFANNLEKKRAQTIINNQIIDYSFEIKTDDTVILKPRTRGNPVDKLVSELMILANCTWGRLLTNNLIPAIYRVKQGSYPVKMTLEAKNHTGLNVDYYTWATSPLRRSVDFINQHQIISLITQDKNYLSALNPELLQVAENFDPTYAKYLAFQDQMELFWTLKYILQQNIYRYDASAFFKFKVQLLGLPLIIDLQHRLSTKPQAGDKFIIELFNINLANISYEYRIISCTGSK